MTVRLATAADAGEVARLLVDFNTEFADPTPEPPVLAERLAPMLESGEVTVVLGGAGPDGLALLRFRPSFWSGGLDAYLEELYVAPPERGQGIGRALMEARDETARERGATRMDLEHERGRHGRPGPLRERSASPTSSASPTGR